MSYLLNKLSYIFKCTNIRNISTCSPVSGYITADWVGGKCPKYKDEWSIAAQKYNLHRKEYDYYLDSEYSYGDYPKIPFKGVALKDFHYPYDIPEHRRNFNDPVHIDIDMIGEDKYDAGIKEHVFYSSKAVVGFFVFVFGSLYGICYIFPDFISFQRVTEKQYPWKDKIHYTFEKLQ